MVPFWLCCSIAIAALVPAGHSSVEHRMLELRRPSRTEWLPDDPPPVLENMVGAIFHQDNATRFPPTDPEASTGDLKKRQIEPPIREMMLGPAFPISNCIFCRSDVGRIKDDSSWTSILDFMTVDTFKRFIKGTPKDLTDSCIFYTKSVLNKGQLSAPATHFACMNFVRSHYSIWHLFPNKEDQRWLPNQVRDFYCLWDEGDHWLAPVRDEAIAFKKRGDSGASPAIKYFQAMSQAMAESCSGNILIMTWTPTELREYEPGKTFEHKDLNNIFWSHERIELIKHVDAGRATVLVVDAADPMAGARRVTNTDSWSVGPLQPYSTWWKRDQIPALEAELRERALCLTSGLGSQAGGLDYFNDGQIDRLPPGYE